MSSLASRDLFVLLALIVVGAAVIVVHLVALRRLLVAGIARRAKALAFFVPPAAPVVAWKSGHRKTAATWLVIVAAYAVLRLLA